MSAIVLTKFIMPRYKINKAIIKKRIIWIDELFYNVDEIELPNSTSIALLLNEPSEDITAQSNVAVLLLLLSFKPA